MFSVIAASSFRRYGSGGEIPPTNELAISIITPTEGQTVTEGSKTTFKIVGATGLNITEPTEGQTVNLPSKTKLKVE